MKHSGSARNIASLLFPNGFSGDVMELIIKAWDSLTLPDTVTHETPITSLLRDNLCKINDYNRISWIGLEDTINDLQYGTELGRNDLRFYPPRHARQSVFFTVECKRLHAPHGSLINEYIKDGMMRFIENRYSQNLSCGAMIGYVLDGNTDIAFTSLCKNIKKQKDLLKLSQINGITVPSKLLKLNKYSSDTLHLRNAKEFILHHVLLPVIR